MNRRASWRDVDRVRLESSRKAERLVRDSGHGRRSRGPLDLGERPGHLDITMAMRKIHVAVVHSTCTDTSCPICEGGLFLCSVCGGSEGSLLPSCPGRQLTYEEDQENYRHFCADTGPFAKTGAETRRLNSIERRRIYAMKRRMDELRRRLDEPSFVGPSRPYVVAEASALRWALRVMQAAQDKTLREILEFERETERTETASSG